jgi:hypothetical protein
MIFKKFFLILLFSLVRFNVHGDLTNPDTSQNPYYPLEKRPVDYFDERYDKTLSAIQKLSKDSMRPSRFSTEYWGYLAKMNALKKEAILKQEGKSLDSSSEEFKILQEMRERQRVERILRSQLGRMKEYRTKNYYRLYTNKVTPETIRSPFDMMWYEDKLFDYYNFSWKNINKYGLTVQETQQLVVLIGFIRFCFYTLRYDARSGLIISGISTICAMLYTKLLIDAANICYMRLYLNPGLFRMAFEEYFEMEVRANAYKEPFSIFKYFPAWLIKQMLYYIPNLTDLESYINNELTPQIAKFFARYRKPIKTLLIYTLIIRLGKRYVPYPLIWHGTFYYLYTQLFGDPVYQVLVNSMEFLKDGLIPKLRIEEIEMMEILQMTFITGIIYSITLGMLHAAFSQYYYIPFITPMVEAHAGKRPKGKFYSGGYCSWQDELELFTPSKGDYKIWFGFLGKGSGDKFEKRTKPEPVSIIINWVCLMGGLVGFSGLWIYVK